MSSQKVKKARGVVKTSFLPVEDSSELDPDTKFVLKAVEKLEEFIRRKRRISRRFSRKKWVQDMRLLLKDLNGDKKRLKKVLLGYIKEEHDEWTPWVESAKTFRDKFLRIESWLERKRSFSQKNNRSSSPSKSKGKIKVYAVDENGKEVLVDDISPVYYHDWTKPSNEQFDDEDLSWLPPEDRKKLEGRVLSPEEVAKLSEEEKERAKKALTGELEEEVSTQESNDSGDFIDIDDLERWYQQHVLSQKIDAPNDYETI